jgi:hypothetical protein
MLTSDGRNLSYEAGTSLHLTALRLHVLLFIEIEKAPCLVADCKLSKGTQGVLGAGITLGAAYVLFKGATPLAPDEKLYKIKK